MAAVTFMPARLDVRVYGSDPWALNVDMSIDLTGADIVAKLKPRSSSPSVEMNVTPVDLAAGKFAVSDVGGRGGEFDIEITLPDASPRTFVYGSISLRKDVA